MPTSLSDSDERICNRFNCIVPAINDELNISFGQTSNALITVSAILDVQIDSSAHLKRREWCRCTGSSGSSILVPGLGLVCLAGTHDDGRLTSYLDAAAANTTVLLKDCSLRMQWQYPDNNVNTRFTRFYLTRKSMTYKA